MLQEVCIKGHNLNLFCSSLQDVFVFCLSLTLYQKLSQLLQHFRFDQIKLDAFYQDAYIIAEFCSTVFEGIVAL